MPAAHCLICLTHIQIEEFVVFPCGHGWCSECTDALFRDGRPKCPNCRKVLNKREGHPLYIPLVDSAVAYNETLKEGIDQMKSDTPLLSVRKASKKLEKVAQGNDVGTADLSALLKAIEDFRDRIIPLYSKTEDQQKEITTLRVERDSNVRLRANLATRIKKLEPLQGQLEEMAKAMQDSDRQRSDAIQLAEIANDKLGKAHESLSSWQKNAADLEKENQLLKDSLERFNNSAQLQKSKSKRLKEQVASLTRKLEAAEREHISDATHGYDGDFSGYEHTKTERSFALSSPKRSFHHNENEVPVKLDFVGMPPPKFPSEWQLQRKHTGEVLKKVNRRPPDSRLPLDLVKGKPTKAVQLGPKHIVHVSRR